MQNEIRVKSFCFSQKSPTVQTPFVKTKQNSLFITEGTVYLGKIQFTVYVCEFCTDFLDSLFYLVNLQSIFTTISYCHDYCSSIKCFNIKICTFSEILILYMIDPVTSFLTLPPYRKEETITAITQYNTELQPLRTKV